MDAMSLEDLEENFLSKCKAQSLYLELRDYGEDETCIQQMMKLGELVNQYCSAAALLREDYVNIETEKLKRVKQINDDLSKLKTKLLYVVDNVPERMPKPAPVIKESTDRKQSHQVVKPHKHTNGNAAPANQNKAAASSGHVQKKPVVNVYFPEIDFLTVDEFQQVPKYLKGRLTYNQINKFVEAMNASYKAKYKLLKMSKSTMNDANRKQYEAYERQGTKDTKGCYFIVDVDIKEHGGTKVDKVANSILTILRHCGRIKEVRGGQLTRYVYIDRY